jgi:hypothetical protein
MSEPTPPKKQDSISWLNDQFAEVGRRFKIRENPKALFLYTIFLSIMILLDNLTNISVYKNIALVLAILFLIIAYADLESTRREKKKEKEKKSETKV